MVSSGGSRRRNASRGDPSGGDRQAGGQSIAVPDAELRDHIVHLSRYARMLLPNRAEAEDLVQDCLANVLARADGQEAVRNMRRYLLAAARNLYIARCRQHSREPATLPLGHVVDRLGCRPNADDRLELRDIAFGVAQLPVRQREAILLIALEGLSYRQVAIRLHLPIGTVQSRVHRARAALGRLR
jgi:RNA polymerase sigma-70 factor (ECF subfamily)